MVLGILVLAGCLSIRDGIKQVLSKIQKTLCKLNKSREKFHNVAVDETRVVVGEGVGEEGVEVVVAD